MSHSFHHKIVCLVLIGTLLASPALACSPLEEDLSDDLAFEKSDSSLPIANDSCALPESSISSLPSAPKDGGNVQTTVENSSLLTPGLTEAQALTENPVQGTPAPLSLTPLLAQDAASIFARNSSTITGFSSAYLESVRNQSPNIIYVDLVIPADIGGQSITAIASSAFLSSKSNLPDNLRIRTLDLSQASALTQIGDYAFYNTSGPLYSEFASTQLILPSSLQTIGSNAFNGLKTFRGDLTLPDSITAIGNSAFQNCGFDGTLTLPTNAQFTTIPTQAFKDNHFTGTLTLPDQITTIEGNYAFEGNAFSTISWPDTLQNIGSSSFIDCTQLTHLPPLPANLQRLDNNVFKNCAQLDNQSIRLPDSLIAMGNTVFDGTPVQTIYLPNNPTTTYGDHFFFDYSALTAIVAPNKTIYDHIYITQETKQRLLCAYPLTLTFYDTQKQSVGTREVLYNRPLNYSLDEATGVWAADEAYELPQLEGGTVLGYDLSWCFDPSGKVAAAKDSLVTGDSLYAALTLQKPTVLTPTVNTLSKTYDGTPLTLSVELEHPLEGMAVGDLYFYYKYVRVKQYQSVPSYEQWSHQKTYDKVINVSDSAPGNSDWYLAKPYVYQFSSSSKLTYLYSLPDIYYYVTIEPAAPTVHPLCPTVIEPGMALTDVSLSSSDGDTPGQLTWQDPAQIVASGTKDYAWTFTPDDQENYLSLTGTLTLTGKSASAPLPPTVSLPSGSYVGSQQITLQSAEADTRIYYTIDESDPANSDTARLYQTSAPLYINKSLTLRAAVQNSSGDFSDSINLEYHITPQSQAIIPQESEDTAPLLPNQPDITPDQLDIVYHEAVEPAKQQALATAPLPQGFTPSDHFFELQLTINLVPQAEAQLTHKITVSVPYAGSDREQYKVAHLKSDRSTEILDAQWHPENQTLQFAIDSFSPFLVLVQPRSSSSGGSSGDFGGAAQSETRYTVAATSGPGGRMEPEGTSTFAAGSQKTWHILPEEGYIIGNIMVDGRSVGAVDYYTLPDIRADHTITAAFLPQLDDVKPDAWYYDAVLSAYRQQLLRGTSMHTFAPEETVNRAMAAALLHRLSGEPSTPAAQYADVSSADWYAQPISWLTTQGLAFGFPDGGFHPTAPLTRQELAALLYRYAAFRGLTVTAPEARLADFADAGQIDAWAREPLAWAAANGLLTADDHNQLRPAQIVTRAELSSIIIRFTRLLPQL